MQNWHPQCRILKVLSGFMSFKQSLHAIHPIDDKENAVDDDLITVGWSVTSRDLSETEEIK